MTKWLFQFVFVVVTVVWAVNFFAPYFDSSQERDPTINGVFMATVGIAFGKYIKDNVRGEK